MAAADPYQLRHQRFEDVDGAAVVAVGEGLDAATEADRARTRSEFSIGSTGFHLRQSGLQGVPVGRRRDQRVMNIAKMRACLGEESIAISGDVAPMRLQPRSA